MTADDDRLRDVQERLAARLSAEPMLDPDLAEAVRQQVAHADPRTRLLWDALEAGVPWASALEAIASTRLDRDETHEVIDQPAWLHEDPDGYRIVDRD